MAEHRDIELSVELENERITYPKMTIRDKDYFFLPFNMRVGNAILKTAMVTPLCILNNEDKAYIFYGDCKPQFVLEGDLGKNKVIAISRKEARDAWKVVLDREYLIISEQVVLQTERGVELIGRSPFGIKVYPELTKTPEGWAKLGKEEAFTVYQKEQRQTQINVTVMLKSQSKEKKEYSVCLDLSK